MNKKTHILILENNLADADCLPAFLKENKINCKTTLVHDKDSFVSALNNNNCQLILSDYTLANLSGLAALQIAKEKRPDIPFIFVSKKLPQKLILESLSHGANDFVTKDDMSRLITAIKKTGKDSQQKKRINESEDLLMNQLTFLQVLINAIPNPVFYKDINGCYLGVNTVFEKNIGLPDSNSSETNIIEFTSEEATDKYNLLDQSLYNQTGDDTFEAQIKYKDGSLHDVIINQATFMKYDNNPGGIVGIINDITERKETEKQLAYEKNLLHSLLSNIPDIIYFKDTQSRFIRINQAQAKLLDLQSPEDAIGKMDSDFFPKEFAEATLKDEQRMMESGVPLIDKVEKIVKSDENAKWISATKVPIFDTTGKITGIVGISRDVTERINAEEALKDKITRLQLLKVLNETFQSTMDLNKVFSRVYEVIPQYLSDRGVHMASLFLHDPELDILVDAHQLDNKSASTNIASKFSEICFKEQRPIIINDCSKSKLISSDYAERLQIKSTIAVPIKSRQKVIGVLRLDNTSSINSFANSDIELFTMIGEQLAIVLENAMLFKEQLKMEEALNRRIQLEKMVTTISSNFIHYTSEEIDNGIDYTIMGVGNFLNVQRSYLFLFSGDGNYIDKTFEWTESISDLKTEKFKNTPVDTFPWIISMLSNFEVIHLPFFAEDTFGESSEEQKQLFAGTKSLILVPMVYGSRLRGFMGYERLQSEYKWNEEDLDQLATIADIIINAVERKRAEEALQSEKEELSVTLRSITDGVITTDLEDKINLVNNAAEEIVGVEQKWLLGKSIFSVLEFHKEEPVIKETKKTSGGYDNLNQESQMNDYLILLSRSGKKLTISINSNVLRDQKGKVRGFVYIIRDMTERLKIEKQLSLSQKMESIGRLAAGIAHEINTPMQYISDNTNFLKDAFESFNTLLTSINESVKDSAAFKDFVQIIKAIRKIQEDFDIPYFINEIPSAIEQTQVGIERVSKIISAMKDFAHPEQREKTFSDLNHGIQVTAAISKNEWKYVADLEMKLDPTLPAISCIPDEINQVILNLIINAVHAIQIIVGKDPGTKGKIVIETKHVDKVVEFRISDTGTGIKPEDLGRIFDPFFTTKEVGKGTGQGLSLAHDIIVNKHKGSITAESSYGKGATFIIQLPIS
ncbi:MAG: PAS domain S-box protein [Ignavibacteriaceae bacterium]|jgi:PAS domain S-box-containing protein